MIIQNNKLTVTIKEKGAELSSIVDTNNIEYIWSGDPKYWKDQSPILFPNVGHMKDNEYIFDGHTYQMPVHGFAREYIFDITEETSNSVIFTLKSSDNTKKLYPFEFVLNVVYILDENTLTIKYIVENLDNKSMGFKIGGHPGINCPILKDENFDDYKITFNKDEDVKTYHCSKKGPCEQDEIGFTGNTLKISHELFHERVIIFENLKSTTMTLESDKNNYKVEFDISNFPFVALWSPDAPFICFEPWFGHSDFEWDSKELMEKSTITKLPPNKKFECAYKISINN